MKEKPVPGFALWLTGLPSSGKTTLAQSLEAIFLEHNTQAQILDSDNLRQVLTPEPSYSKQERDWFYQALVYIAGLLTDNGVNVLIAATGPRRAHRQLAQERISCFAEVYLKCPKEVCMARDPKGLWQKSASGDISNLPGADSPYEVPRSPDVTVDTANLPPQEAAIHVFEGLKRQGFFSQSRY